jgi:hypothetical protein
MNHSTPHTPKEPRLHIQGFQHLMWPSPCCFEGSAFLHALYGQDLERRRRLRFTQSPRSGFRRCASTSDVSPNAASCYQPPGSYPDRTHTASDDELTDHRAPYMVTSSLLAKENQG